MLTFLFHIFFFVLSVSSWSAPNPMIQMAPPTSSPVIIPSHKRTPSEADRWLEEVSKSVRVPTPSQPFPTVALHTGQPLSNSLMPISTMTPPSVIPLTLTPPQPSAAPLLPPRQPAFPMQAAASYSMANGIPFPQPIVPVVGITPSQMVANVFGSASTPLQHDAPVVCSTGSFVKVSAVSPTPPAIGDNCSATFNGADGWAAAALAAPHPTPHTLPMPREDAFEAQWVALEGQSRQRTLPTNPFSTDLHKTFEIEL